MQGIQGRPNLDSIQAWWLEPSTTKVLQTADPMLYANGVHARRFTYNFTAGPGAYTLVLKFAATHAGPTPMNRTTIEVNGERFVTDLDVEKAAGGTFKALDLVKQHVAPRNGVVDVRFIAGDRSDPHDRTEAFVQAMALLPE